MTKIDRYWLQRITDIVAIEGANAVQHVRDCRRLLGIVLCVRFATGGDLYCEQNTNWHPSTNLPLALGSPGKCRRDPNGTSEIQKARGHSTMFLRSMLPAARVASQVVRCTAGSKMQKHVISTANKINILPSSSNPRIHEWIFPPIQPILTPPIREPKPPIQHKLIERNPPPRGGFLFTMFPWSRAVYQRFHDSRRQISDTRLLIKGT